ncbi:unnamed protein product [Nezara viridula]|uniref:Uncharacterized protein n=1 Tax=Nezara viridula TaxID=85310 RepID=A0A9P0E9J5_NEZVI|nr:unnamed protein product [Nezara viridula]
MGESYPTDRYSPVDRYVPRYPAPPPNTGRYLDPYSRRDIYLPPPRYLRPLHRYTPRPTRIEYRAHVEYLGSSGGSTAIVDCLFHFIDNIKEATINSFKDYSRPTGMSDSKEKTNGLQSPRDRMLRWNWGGD